MALRRDPHPDDATKAAAYLDAERGVIRVKYHRRLAPVEYQVYHDGRQMRDVEFRRLTAGSHRPEGDREG